MLLAQLAIFQSLPPLLTNKLGPSGADSQVGGCVCVYSRTLWVSPVNSPVRLVVSLLPKPPKVFPVRGFEALFPHAVTLGCSVCLAPQLFLRVYLHANVGLPDPPAAALTCILCAPAACLHTSYQSDQHRSFDLLRFRPGPVHPSLGNLVAPRSQEVTILMPNLVRTSDQHSSLQLRTARLKQSCLSL